MTIYDDIREEALATEKPAPTLLNPAARRWQTARKTKPILAKPMQSLLSDQRILAKFLLSTLEGTQTLRGNSMVCLGNHNDVWQQDRAKLHKQYTPSEVLEDGWTVFTPKPEAERSVTEVKDSATFAIKAQWGTRMPDGSFEQYGKEGDYLVQSKEDPNDVWIVAKAVFEATYEILRFAPESV
jgi:hypothetical protein